MLWNNSLRLSENISDCVKPVVFRPLNHLEVLDIHGNSPHPAYPPSMWRYLQTLTELSLESPQLDVFDSGFTALRKLHTLSISGQIPSVEPDMFKGLRLSPIQKLEMVRCHISSFQGLAFKHLRALTWLSVANNTLDVALLNMASGFSFISLQHLDMNKTAGLADLISFMIFSICGSTLKSLTVSYNDLPSLYDIPHCLPELQVFSISHNGVVHTTDIMDLLNMSHIRELDMSWQRTTAVSLQETVKLRKFAGFHCLILWRS